MNKVFTYIVMMVVMPIFVACNSGKASNAESTTDSVNVPEFNADSAKSSIDIQCGFGERTMGSKAHDDCVAYMIEAFKQQGCEVTRQDAEFTIYNGQKFKGCNVIASYNPKATDRIMICSHYDSRPWADADDNPANNRKPVMAANDGASGIAVMIEIARQLKAQAPNIGVDFVCFDAEDAGVPDWDEENYSGDTEATWCLGSQYWASNPHRVDFRFAILLDMVGGKMATFYQEQFSLHYAQSAVLQVWAAASEAGYSSIFPTEAGGAITDDHLPINRIAGIPAIDIIPYYPNDKRGFGPTWHTVNDTPENIDINTLKAVGQTLLQLIYTI